MYNSYYPLVSIIALFILLTTNFDIVFNKRYQPTNPNALRAYRIFIVSLIAFYVTDILWGYLDSLPNKTPVVIDTSFFYVNMAVVVFAWTNFVVNFIEGTKIFKYIFKGTGYLFALFGTVIVIVNFFIPILFSYDATSFIPSGARSAYLGSQAVMFAFVSIYALVASIRSKGYKRGQYIVLGVFGLVMAICISFQIYYLLFPIYALGTASGSMLVYTFIVVSQRIRSREQLIQIKDREREQSIEIESTRQLAYVDPLTGVKNKHAYVEFETEMDKLIHDKEIDDFSIIVFDLNDLKYINDKYGHEAGDNYIIDSCNLIKEYFPNAEIFRYGGDEFVLYVNDGLYEERFARLKEFNNKIESNIYNNGPVIACGISDYDKEKDNTLRIIFVRADDRMYGRKRRLKDLKNNSTGDYGNKSTGASLENLRYEMYEMFYRSSGISLLDMLNASSCDEIMEVNIKKDRFQQFYHVEGKYFVPAVDLSYKDLIDFTYKYIVHPDDRSVFINLMNPEGFFERLANSRIPNFDFAHFRYKLQDGKYRWVEQVVIAGEEYGLADGTFRMYVFDINNIKTRQLGIISNESSVVSVGRDSLTGLLSSKDFLIQAEKMIDEDREKNWCLITIDIEHFKLFDEWFGREKGNYLLAKIAAEIKEFEAKNHALAGYFGHDDFSIMCEYNEEKIKEIYENLKQSISSFGLTAGFLPAFGVAIIEKDMAVVDALDRASIAIAKAKTELKDRICVYNYQMQFHIEQEHIILTDFIHALQEEEITFFLQPQCLASTGQIVGAEALSRWIKKDGTIISPGEFIPVLEKYGFIVDLDKYIWERVFKWLKSWLDSGHKCVPISLNVSRIDIYNIDIAEYFNELCNKYDLPHNLIKLEITESAYAETTDTIDELVKTLRSNGFMVLMDDFGSGYSSLNMLSTLKLDAIKLDARFLRIEGADHTRGIHVLESVVNMAKTMALPIIVEGAEKKNQIDFLSELGVKYIQGFYFYRPMPAKDFEQIIENESNMDLRGFVAKSNEQFRIREFLDKNLYSDSMLNNIIGSVAIYSYDEEHVDIIRYNQQFFEAVNVPDFLEKLVHIENVMPEEDRPLLFKALEDAKENKLTGSSQTLRFMRQDGIMSSFRIHFYYLGKKEGTDRFYGSAVNVTELTDLAESKKLVAKYSSDNMIFVKKVSGHWQYSVMSHQLSDVVGLSVDELEKELNNGEYAKRVVSQKDLKDFMKLAAELPNKKGVVTEKEFAIITNKQEKIKIRISIEYVGDESNNIEYILKTYLAE